MAKYNIKNLQEFLEIDSSGTFSKKKTSTPKTFLYFFLSQQVIRTSSKQNKFTFHPIFKIMSLHLMVWILKY